MERTVRKIAFTLVIILLVAQGYLFYKQYHEEAYATQGEQMWETTWLYAKDTLHLQVKGQLPADFSVLKNGEPLALQPNAQGNYILEVREYDLIAIEGSQLIDATAEITVKLEKGVFQEKFYADVFDYAGGSVAVGWFVKK